MTQTYVKEIFESVQGEALYIGEKQLFIRFCGCNLNCDYCDTDFKKEEKFLIHNSGIFETNPVSPDKLSDIVQKFSAKTVSLTGGEPLLYADFLAEFLPLVQDKKIYLETNGSVPDELEKIIKFVDVVSMDIKLSCSTGESNRFVENEKFINIAKRANKEIFAKIVLNKNYQKDELKRAINILNKTNTMLIVQPMDCKDKSNELDKKSLIELFDFVTELCPNARLIGQMHKYLKLL